METEKLEIIEPVSGFYMVQIETLIEDEKTGKPKKTKEVVMVDAVNPTEVEKKVVEYMEGTMFQWDIVSIVKSKVGRVF